MKTSNSFIILMLALFVAGCSDKTPKIDDDQNLDHIEESIHDTADDVEQKESEEDANDS